MKKIFIKISLTLAIFFSSQTLNANELVFATSVGDETATVSWLNFEISEKTVLNFSTLDDSFDSHEYKNTSFDFTYMYSESLGLKFGSWSPEFDTTKEDAITIGTIWNSGNLFLGLDYYTGDNIDGTAFNAQYIAPISEKNSMWFWHGQGWEDGSGNGSFIVPDTTMIGWDYFYSDSTTISFVWRSIDFNVATASTNAPWIGFNFSF
tara:strand:+ start:2918 stop:3538 length:621 start_codon:yes stop_codon:yes gene_type:complete